MNLIWTDFTESDWNGFAGAERFADGAPPQQAEIKVDGLAGLAIFDAQLVAVMWWAEREDGSTEDFERYLSQAAVTKLRPEMTSAELDKLPTYQEKR